jgi:hypothetical protein
MNSILSSEYGIGLISVAFVVFLAMRAWTHGALKMFWAIIGLALGATAGFFFFQNANPMISRFLPGRELSLNANLGCSVIVASVAYLIFRQLSKTVLQNLFGPDGFLSGWAEGFRGSVLSLVPSLLTVLVVGLALRMGGTLMELRSAEKICQRENDYNKVNYPGWSPLADLRDSFERLPYVTDIYSVIDPISRKPERQLALLLVTTKKDVLFEHLHSHPATAPIVNGPLFQALMTDEAISKLLEDRKHAALLRHPQIVAAASNEVLAHLLSSVDLHQLVDDFMLSEDRQNLLNSYKRPTIPEF